MSKETILYFIAYFVLYSIVGWILESVSKSFIQKKAVNSGFLIGPICPIYGFGAIIMLLCLNFLKDNPVVLFFAAFFILSVWEYFVGLLLEKLFKTKYWDYSKLKFNIHGRVCLKNSIYWGILGLLFIKFIHPFVESYIIQVPVDYLLYSEILIVSIFIIDAVTSIKEIAGFETAMDKINELGENIKEKIEELKNTTHKNAEGQIAKSEQVIKRLKIKQAKLKIRIYRQANRLKRAFPSMKSEFISRISDEKIDLKKLKDSIKNKE